jgi:hypothetical protein
MQKKYITWLTLLALVLLALFFFVYNPLVVFSTKTKIVIHPTEEWELAKTIDGNLISVHKNHLKNYVQNYAVTEFQRGDAVRFMLNPKIFDQENITIGDTIGYIYSNEEQRRLIQLIGELGVLEAELEFHTTGQKPEDVLYAEGKLFLAEQELETQRKLMRRSEELILDNVISKEQFDIDLNELKVKELSVELAKANLSSVDTGEKPEMEKLVRSKMTALSNEIEQIKSRLDLLTVISPISGKILIDHGSMIQTVISQGNETIVKIVSNDKPIGLMPIRIKHRSAISKGNQVTFRRHDAKGKVVLINNTAQISVSSPYLFYVVDLEEYDQYTFGEIQDVVVHGAKIPFTEFLTLHLSH